MNCFLNIFRRHEFKFSQIVFCQKICCHQENVSNYNYSVVLTRPVSNSVLNTESAIPRGKA